jgi:hypothetical protein
VALAPTSVSVGDESAAVITVTVAAHLGEAVATGDRATVHVGSASCVAVLTAGKGTCTVASRALKAGKYRVTAAYRGDDDLLASSGAATKILTVRS